LRQNRVHKNGNYGQKLVPDASASLRVGDHELAPGDRLPLQEEIRDASHLSDASAVKNLVLLEHPYPLGILNQVSRLLSQRVQGTHLPPALARILQMPFSSHGCREIISTIRGSFPSGGPDGIDQSLDSRGKFFKLQRIRFLDGILNFPGFRCALAKRRCGSSSRVQNDQQPNCSHKGNNQSFVLVRHP